MQHTGPAKPFDPRYLSKPRGMQRECAFYQEHGQRFRRKHLNTRLRIAKEQEDKEAFQKISSIIQQEHQRNFWRKLNFVTGKKRTRSATSIQVEGKGGIIMEHTTQETVEKTIFSKVHKSSIHWQEKPPFATENCFRTSGTKQTPKQQGRY